MEGQLADARRQRHDEQQPQPSPSPSRRNVHLYPEPASQTTQRVAAPAITTHGSLPVHGDFLAPAPLPSPSQPIYRPHNPARSSHFRSRSSGSSVLAPPMSRAHSSPIVPSASTCSQPSTSPAVSPRAHPARLPTLRSLSPFQPLLDDPHAPAYDGSIESISEDAELHIRPRTSVDQIPQPVPLHATRNSGRSLSARRQRPTSPLHSIATTNYSAHSNTPRSVSATSSPSVPPARFNENYPTLHHYASNSSFSSMPSTPTSMRSRSPSVSSLDTIEDAPDLEWEAVEADRAAKLSAVDNASAKGERDGESRRRGSLDIPGMTSGAVGFGFGRRGGDSAKKRWSVCGGERRADLDLETIWED
ncbi:hypothetical protein AAFC00_004741 [Neodothiora populina]